jgi:hypothetical protein
MTDGPFHTPALTPGIPFFDSALFEQLSRAADILARSTLMPETLRGESEGRGRERKFTPHPYEVTFANAFIVCNLAWKWRADPVAVAQEVSLVHGKLVLSGKLISALIENSLGFPLDFEWSGEENASRRIKVSGKRPTDTAPKSIEGSALDWLTKDSSGQVNAQWSGASRDKMLANRGAREWCRLYMPGLMMGLYGADEFDEPQPIEAEAVPTIRSGFASTPAPAVPAIADQRAAQVDVSAALAATAPKAEPEHVESRAFTQDEVAKLSAPPPPPPAPPAPPPEPKPPKVSKHAKAIGKAIHEATERLAGMAEERRELGLPLIQPVAWAVEAYPAEHDEEGLQRLLGDLNKLIDASTAQLVTARAEADERRLDTRDAEGGGPPTGEKPAPADIAPDPHPFDAILQGMLSVLRPFKEWDTLRAQLATVFKQSEVAALGLEQKNVLYREAWGVINALNQEMLHAGKPWAVNPTEDAMAYRCALEGQDDVELVRLMWAELISSEAWNAQAGGTQEKLRSATEARLAKLGG